MYRQLDLRVAAKEVCTRLLAPYFHQAFITSKCQKLDLYSYSISHNVRGQVLVVLMPCISILTTAYLYVITWLMEHCRLVYRSLNLLYCMTF